MFPVFEKKQRRSLSVSLSSIYLSYSQKNIPIMFLFTTNNIYKYIYILENSFISITLNVRNIPCNVYMCY